MRLAFLTHEPFHPPSGGGSAEAVYLVREFVRRGHQVRLFCPAFPEADRVAADFGIEIHPFTRWRMGRYTAFRNIKYLAYPRFLQRLVEPEVAARPVDLLFSQHAIAAVTAGRLKRRLGRPVVMNFLDYLTGFMETWPAWVAPRPLVRQLMRYELSLPHRYDADAVLTVSDTLADRFAAAGVPRQRLCPIYYGYDAALFQPPSGLPPGADTPPVVVMHGSFDQHHLGPIAATALRHVHATRPDVRVRFVGRETPTLRAFRLRVQSALPSLQWECTGFVPYAEVGRQLTNAAVGIVPYEESTGVHCAFVAKIVEYLGVGLPVVSTALQSAQRYFGQEPAVRFTAFDGAAFGAAMLEWLAMPAAERSMLGRAAAARVARALDWSSISRRAVDRVEEAGRASTAPPGGRYERAG